MSGPLASAARPVLRVPRELGMNPAAIYLLGSRLTRQPKAEVEKLRAQRG